MVQRDDQKSLPKRWVGCDVEEEYFGDDRKLSKKERKFASAKDRSKYKKTDREKMQKPQKVPDKDLIEGRVLSIVPEGIIVEHAHTSIICALRGVLKKEKSQHKNLVTVGDIVNFELITPTEGQIGYIKPRRSILSRADNLSRRKEQLIAANIDQVLVTASVVSPSLNFALIDRYIIAAQKGNMQPVVIINKVDLLDRPQEPLIAQEKERVENLIQAYQAVDIPTIPVSVVTGEGIEELKKCMQDKASVFSGQSGVGKSSLINAITGLNLETRLIVEKTQKGSHTTSTAKLIPLEFGGWCIDTPGIRSFGIWDLSKDEVEQYFSEIYTVGHHCRYPDCAHIHEKGCAVQEAVEKGEISVLRYSSYVALIESISQEHLRR